MSEAKLEAYFFTTIFIGALVLTGYLFYPFFGALALALVLAILGAPVYDHVRKYVRNDSAAALLVVLVLTLAILIPAAGVFFLLLGEVSAITSQVTSIDFHTMPALIASCELKLKALFPVLSSVDLSSVLATVAQNVGAFVAGAVTGTANALLKLLVALIALFYFIKDGQHFVRGFIALSPLTDDEDVLILRKLKAVTHSVIRGTLVIACVQGLLVGIGFLLTGVPDPVLWGAVGAVSAIVPTIGTGLVMIPGVLWLLFTGNTTAALLLTVWGFFVVGVADNVIGARLVGKHAHIHPLLVLLAVLGGLALFGFPGFFVGPLILALLMALSDIYIAKIRELHASGGAA